MTLGEMARMANDVLGIGTDLVVVPAAGWTRAMMFDATGLPWVKPSPNMPDLESALHYPGICLFEGTNLSVGRGTEFAFQVIGAPWLDADAVRRRLPAAATIGVEVTSMAFTPRRPTDRKYDGAAVRGLRFRVVDRERYDATHLAVALLVAIRDVHPTAFQFRATSFDQLAAGPALRLALQAGRPAQEIWAMWDEDLTRFRAARVKYLLY
jgi:uncharacterized protein YbbC (DUF1343 family)